MAQTYREDASFSSPAVGGEDSLLPSPAAGRAGWAVGSAEPRDQSAWAGGEGTPQTLAEKILSRAAGERAMAGDLVVVDVAMAMSHDSLAQSVFRAMTEMGMPNVHDPNRVAFFVDHVAPASSVQVAEAQAMLRRYAREQGVANFFDAGTGICHQVMIEQHLVTPGTVAVGADSHSTLYGCVGAFGTGMGSTDVAVAMSTGRTWLRVPATIRVDVVGELPPGVSAKDATLQLVGQLGAAGARYMAVEYSLPATLDLPSRMTLCGMTTEIGAKAGIVIPDAVTAAYAPVPDWLYPDPDAVYAQRVTLDLSSLEPLVAEPGHVDRVTPVSAIGDVPVDMVFIGTCTNGRLDDLHAAAEVLRGRHIHPRTRMMVVPASHETLSAAAADGTLGVLLAAGATLGTPGCGPCMGRHMGALAAGEVCLSTGNRNFAGRMGSAQASIYLGSPAVAAATAVAGRLAAPGEVTSD